jgi:hypothetical protein
MKMQSQNGIRGHSTGGFDRLRHAPGIADAYGVRKADFPDPKTHQFPHNCCDLFDGDLAVEAGVPIVCGYLDYRQRRAGLGHLVWPTGDPAADMAAIRAFYEDKRGKFPDQETPVVLKEEGSPASGASAAP